MTQSAAELRELRRAYRENFSTPQGTMVLDDLRDRCGYNRSSFESGLAEETAFFEGRRWMILYIHKKMSADDELLLKQVERQEK